MRLFLIRIARLSRSAFWRDASTLEGSATLSVLPSVLVFGAIGLFIAWAHHFDVIPKKFGIEITSFEVGGVALGALLVLRTNEGIGRWWEGRKLWGGIVNQSRNLAASALAYGPRDQAWRKAIVRWTIVFAHTCRRSLRSERSLPEVAALVGDEEAARIAGAEHMPSYVALILARILRVAVDRTSMDRFAFLHADKERMALIDHYGGCERILKTPIPRAYSVEIRRFIFIFLAFLPFGLIPKVEKIEGVAKVQGDEVVTGVDSHFFGWWLTPLIVMAVAYPLLAIDKIGSELQNPFSKRSLNHLDLDGITTTIEGNLLSLLDSPAAALEGAEFVDDLDLADHPSTTPA
jgi:putative membrane protein